MRGRPTQGKLVVLLVVTPSRPSGRSAHALACRPRRHPQARRHTHNLPSHHTRCDAHGPQPAAMPGPTITPGSQPHPQHAAVSVRVGSCSPPRPHYAATPVVPVATVQRLSSSLPRPSLSPPHCVAHRPPSRPSCPQRLSPTVRGLLLIPPR